MFFYGRPQGVLSRFTIGRTADNNKSLQNTVNFSQDHLSNGTPTLSPEILLGKKKKCSKVSLNVNRGNADYTYQKKNEN